MITLFTTFKPFLGNDIIPQVNALRSWRQISSDIEIIVFGENKGETKILQEVGAICLSEVELYNNKLPLISSMFSKVSQIAGNPICCYVNGDILLTKKFSETIRKIHVKLKKNYLLCGQRYDLDIESLINFNKNCEDDFKNKYYDKMILHPPTGSDYFVFPKGQYGINDIPEIVVGLPGWDSWMIYNGVAERKFKVVDLSNTVKVYHQNHKSCYSHNSLIHNCSFFINKAKYIYTLNECNYFTNNLAVKRKSKLQKIMIKIFHKILRIFKIYIKFVILRFNVLKKRRLVVGAATTCFNDWVSTNIDTLDITNKKHWEHLLFGVKLKAVLMEHVLEHLDEDKAIAGLENINFNLRDNGYVRIAVPDGFFPDKNYIDYVKPGGVGAGADDHKVLYNYKSLCKVMESAGFECVLLEYWDEEGKFHYKEWNKADGMIIRSIRYDERNIEGKSVYTSLIVDGYKKEKK